MFDQLGLQGMGTELGTAAWAFIIIKFIIYPLILRIPAVQKRAELRRASNPSNPHSTGNLNKVPGYAKECKNHNDKLIEIGGKLKNVCTGLKNLEDLNRQDHQRFFDKLDKKVDK